MKPEIKFEPIYYKFIKNLSNLRPLQIDFLHCLHPLSCTAYSITTHLSGWGQSQDATGILELEESSSVRASNELGEVAASQLTNGIISPPARM